MNPFNKLATPSILVPLFQLLIICFIFPPTATQSFKENFACEIPGCYSCENQYSLGGLVSFKCSQCNGYYKFKAASHIYNNCVCEANYWKQSPNDRKCEPCSTLTPGCKSCNGGSPDDPYANIYLYKCTECERGYFKSNDLLSLCFPCHQDCFNCTNLLTCDYCYSEYYKNPSGVCLMCHPDCKQCYGTATNCTFCHPGKYLSNNVCNKCQYGCFKCTNSSYCNQCYANFVPKQNTIPLICIACEGSKGSIVNFQGVCTSCSNLLQGCLQCVDSTSCFACQSTMYQANIGFQRFDQFACFKCNKTIDSCIRCTNKSYCLQCDTNTQLINSTLCRNKTSSEICSEKNLNCINCSLTNVCVKCQEGYYLEIFSVSRTQCTSCSLLINNCTNCISKTFCQKCEKGLEPSINRSVCINKIVEQTCGEKYKNCLACNKANLCFRCQESYYLEMTSTDIQCISCSKSIKNCVNCFSKNICSKCSEGLELSINYLECLNKTANPSAPISPEECSKMVQNCLTCNGINLCAECKSGYFISFIFLPAMKNVCLSCQAHILNCIECLYSDFCLKCDEAYILSADHMRCSSNKPNPIVIPEQQLCFTFIQNCMNCSSITQCLKCKEGYFLGSFSTNSSVKNNCNSCSGFMEGCTNCLSSGYCLACEDGMKLNLKFRCVLNMNTNDKNNSQIPEGNDEKDIESSKKKDKVTGPLIVGIVLIILIVLALSKFVFISVLHSIYKCLVKYKLKKKEKAIIFTDELEMKDQNKVSLNMDQSNVYEGEKEVDKSEEQGKDVRQLQLKE